jgi:hypothetical protein
LEVVRRRKEEMVKNRGGRSFYNGRKRKKSIQGL